MEEGTLPLAQGVPETQSALVRKGDRTNARGVDHPTYQLARPRRGTPAMRSLCQPPSLRPVWSPVLGFAILSFAVFLHASSGFAQFDDPVNKSTGSSKGGSQIDETRTVRIQIGVIVKSTGGPLRGVYATAPVPIEWPEQKVRIVDEDFSRHVKRVKYGTVGQSKKHQTINQMEIYIPQIERGGVAKAVVTFEVERSSHKAPESTDGYVIPEEVKGALKPYILASPFIEIRNGKLRKLAKGLFELGEGKTDWEKVKLMYDWVRENIEYKKGPLKGAQKALKDGWGDCEELSSLFIACCRLNGIPARLVWIPGHCYPEFYLEDSEGEGYWFPCQAAGTRAFGSMPEHRIILQKGDNFKVPHEKKRQRYVSEFLRVDAPGGKPPKVEFILKVLSR